MNDNAKTVKYLQYLLYVAIIGAVKAVLDLFLSLRLLSWVGTACSIAVAVLMFQLAGSNSRYKKAGILHAVSIGAALLSVPILPLVLVSLICSLAAVYQEYHAHGELVQERAPELAKKWNGLFSLQIVCSVCTTLLGSVIGAALILAADLDEATSSAIIAVVGAALVLGLKLLYLSYLNRTIKAVSDEFVV